MADKKSTLITNAEAVPPVLLAPRFDGIVRRAHGSILTDAVHADADVLRLFRVHSSWEIVACRLHNADLSSAAAPDLDFGLYLANDGAVLDDDCFVVAQDGAAITNSWQTWMPGQSVGVVETMFELGGSVAGSDDQWYDVAVTIDTAATNIAGLISGEVWYVNPGA